MKTPIEKTVYEAAYYLEHKEEIAVKRAAYYLEHKEERTAWYLDHKEEMAAFYIANKIKINARNSAYDLKHKEEKAATSAAWYLDHKEERIAQCVAYNDNKYHNDPNYRMMIILRSRLRAAMKDNLKPGSAVRDLGCTIPELWLYLEAKFIDGMERSNMGNKPGQWSVDHIIPLSSFDLKDREQFLIACHYTNLQPLWHIHNLQKSNSLTYVYPNCYNEVVL